MSNTTILTGHIGKGDLRYTKAGKPVYGFSVADKIGYGDNEKTQWVECSLWGKRAENQKLTSMLVKGSQVTIKGQIEIEPSQGEYPARLKIPFVDDILHITAKTLGSGGGAGAADTQPTSSGAGQSTPPAPNFDDFDDEIPF